MALGAWSRLPDLKAVWRQLKELTDENSTSAEPSSEFGCLAVSEISETVVSDLHVAEYSSGKPKLDAI